MNQSQTPLNSTLPNIPNHNSNTFPSTHLPTNTPPIIHRSTQQKPVQFGFQHSSSTPTNIYSTLQAPPQLPSHSQLATQQRPSATGLLFTPLQQTTTLATMPNNITQNNTPSMTQGLYPPMSYTPQGATRQFGTNINPSSQMFLPSTPLGNTTVLPGGAAIGASADPILQAQPMMDHQNSMPLVTPNEILFSGNNLNHKSNSGNQENSNVEFGGSISGQNGQNGQNMLQNQPPNQQKILTRQPIPLATAFASSTNPKKRHLVDPQAPFSEPPPHPQQYYGVFNQQNNYPSFPQSQQQQQQQPQPQPQQQFHSQFSNNVLTNEVYLGQKQTSTGSPSQNSSPSPPITQPTITTGNKNTKSKGKEQPIIKDKKEYIDRIVVITVGKQRGRIGKISGSGHGFYCINIGDDDVQKRFSEFELLEPTDPSSQLPLGSIIASRALSSGTYAALASANQLVIPPVNGLPQQQQNGYVEEGSKANYPSTLNNDQNSMQSQRDVPTSLDQVVDMTRDAIMSSVAKLFTFYQGDQYVAHYAAQAVTNFSLLTCAALLEKMFPYESTLMNLQNMKNNNNNNNNNFNGNTNSTLPWLHVEDFIKHDYSNYLPGIKNFELEQKKLGIEVFNDGSTQFNSTPQPSNSSNVNTMNNDTVQVQLIDILPSHIRQSREFLERNLNEMGNNHNNDHNNGQNQSNSQTSFISNKIPIIYCDPLLSTHSSQPNQPPPHPTKRLLQLFFPPNNLTTLPILPELPQIDPNLPNVGIPSSTIISPDNLMDMIQTSMVNAAMVVVANHNKHSHQHSQFHGNNNNNNNNNNNMQSNSAAVTPSRYVNGLPLQLQPGTSQNQLLQQQQQQQQQQQSPSILISPNVHQNDKFNTLLNPSNVINNPNTNRIIQPVMGMTPTQQNPFQFQTVFSPLSQHGSLSTAQSNPNQALHSLNQSQPTPSSPHGSNSSGHHWTGGVFDSTILNSRQLNPPNPAGYQFAAQAEQQQQQQQQQQNDMTSANNSTPLGGHRTVLSVSHSGNSLGGSNVSNTMGNCDVFKNTSPLSSRRDVLMNRVQFSQKGTFSNQNQGKLAQSGFAIKNDGVGGSGSGGGGSGSGSGSGGDTVASNKPIMDLETASKLPDLLQ
jgi:hypothetical protein